MRRSYREQVQSIRHAPFRYHLFELFSARLKRRVTTVPYNLSLNERIGVLGTARLIRAPLDRIRCHVRTLVMNSVRTLECLLLALLRSAARRA
jgi:hypothetical protein